MKPFFKGLPGAMYAVFASTAARESIIR